MAPAAYGTDLAHVHDAGFGWLARDAAPPLLALLGEAGVRDGLVVDLGCGTGILARELLDAGYDVLGVDQSADALAIARGRAPAARFVRGSWVDFEPPPCAAITATGEIFNYAVDPRAGLAALAATLRRAHAALRPGGVLAFDVAVPGREPAPKRTWFEGGGWLLALDAREEGGTLTRRMATFRRTGEGWRRSDEEHVLRLHRPEDVLGALRAAGFAARALPEGYGAGAPLPPGLLAFAAVKGAAPSGSVP